MSYLLTLKAVAGAKLYSFFHDEKGEVNIVATVVLIGIAVFLAIIFKDAISNLIKSLLDTIGNKAENAIS
mgnify:CR=1 FL=1